ncbi:MAG: glycoside hydrolase family 43 protein [Butyrivibrio sp.]|nr:glycoside hydrolase family 43 protein [Butyrivibrio sp.]
MSAYIFAHFKEKTTPDGEQVYFGLSKDGFNWEQVNNGNPVLESHLGEMGVRDFTITRKKDNTFVILATDLALARNFSSKYKSDWNRINRGGSKFLSKWESEDLVNWSEQQLVKVVDENYGCAWAPDIIYDEDTKDYMVHWSSRYPANSDNHMAIFYAKTSDFINYSEPKLLCKKDDTQIIDSNIVFEDGYYYRFVKSDFNPAHIILERGRSLAGDYERMPAFDEEMNKLEEGQYEAPTCYKLPDGSWCLMLDFYGCEKEKQGYVPFVAKDISTGRFVRSDNAFSFPYGFKHGTVMEITDEEYDRIKKAYPND